MSDQRLYDPKNPNLYGYRVCRVDQSLWQFIRGKLYKWRSEALWSLYGRDRIVAEYVHREQSAPGIVENWVARQILKYLYEF